MVYGFILCIVPCIIKNKNFQYIYIYIYIYKDNELNCQQTFLLTNRAQI